MLKMLPQVLIYDITMLRKGVGSMGTHKYFQWYIYLGVSALVLFTERPKYSNRAVNNSNRAVTLFGEV